MRLSVCVITLDEEENLRRCLASVAGLADQIVVLDSLSTDGTREVALAAGAEFHEQPFAGHVAQKQAALELARGDWVLSLDADEWLDEALAAAIREVLDADGPADGYEVNRRTHYLGGWIDHCGWSPEWRLRLVRRACRPRWEGADPHDRLAVDGRRARLGGRLNHRPYRDLGHHLAKIDAYTDVMARDRVAGGERPSLARLLLRPPARWLRVLVLHAGVLDGWRGVVVATMAAFYVFLKYAKIWDLARRASSDD